MVGFIQSGRFSSGTFTPLSIAGCAGWWDASDTATITQSGGNVSQWDDKSGNSRHFTQSDSAKRPTTGTDTINGLNVLTFVKANSDYMDTSSFTLAQPMTVLFVVDRIGITNFQGTFSSVGGSLQLAYSTSSTTRFFAGTEVTAFGSTPTGPIQETYAINGASSASWRSGAAGTGGNIGTSGTTTGFRLAERNLAVYSDQRYAEVLVYNTALGTTDREAAEAYLKTKWGTP